MSHCRLVTACTVLSIGPALTGPALDATAQEPRPTPSWLNRETVDVLAAEWARLSEERYALNPAQSRRLRQVTSARWSRFVEQHRERLAPLLQAYIDAHVAHAPPRGSAGQWARHAEPLLDELREQMRGFRADVRELLTPEQRETFAEDMERGEHVMRALEQRVRAWRNEAAPHGDRAAAASEAPPAGRERRVPTPDTATQAVDRIAEELGRWDEYVRTFIKRYRLDPMQAEAAHSILRECKQRVIAHRQKRADRIKRLERSLAETDALFDTQRRELIALYGPVDAIFAELDTRLQQIPTEAQRHAAQPP